MICIFKDLKMNKMEIFVWSWLLLVLGDNHIGSQPGPDTACLY